MLSQDRSSPSWVLKHFWSAQILGLEEHQWHQLCEHDPQPAHSAVLWLMLGPWQHQCHGRYDEHAESLWFGEGPHMTVQRHFNRGQQFHFLFTQTCLDKQDVLSCFYFSFELKVMCLLSRQIASTLRGMELGPLPISLSSMWSTVAMQALAMEAITLEFGSTLANTVSQMRPAITTRLRTRVRVPQRTKCKLQSLNNVRAELCMFRVPL